MAVDVVIGGSSMDLTSDAGFVGALYHTCRLSPGSGWLACTDTLQTCCMLVYLTIDEAKGAKQWANSYSSFISLFPRVRSRGTIKRSPTHPLGEESYPSEVLGNLLLCRTLVILCVSQALGCFWLLEQPKGSLMEAHPFFRGAYGDG